MNYRNPKLLALARECPHCMACGRYNDGSVVAAHSNRISDGKGTGIKAHDHAIAYCCHGCHFDIDSGKCSREDRQEKWEAAHKKTIAWLFESGHLKVAA